MLIIPFKYSVMIVKNQKLHCMLSYNSIEREIKKTVITTLLFLLFSFAVTAQYNAPVWFGIYKIKFEKVNKLADTISFYRGEDEEYRFVFFDKTGKCYCEKYFNGNLLEKGFFATSGNTSKVLVSARSSKGKTKPIRTEEWFQPVKDGEWKIYENGNEVKSEKYVMGVLQH